MASRIEALAWAHDNERMELLAIGVKGRICVRHLCFPSRAGIHRLFGRCVALQ